MEAQPNGMDELNFDDFDDGRQRKKPMTFPGIKEEAMNWIARLLVTGVVSFATSNKYQIAKQRINQGSLSVPLYSVPLTNDQLKPQITLLEYKNATTPSTTVGNEQKAWKLAQYLDNVTSLNIDIPAGVITQSTIATNYVAKNPANVAGTFNLLA